MPAKSLHLISINIEKERHLNLVLPFLFKENPDVICVQELNERDIELFQEELGMDCFYIPMNRRKSDNGLSGIGIFTHLTVTNSSSLHYGGATNTDLPFDATSPHTKRSTQGHWLAVCDVTKDGVSYTIATTHFTWTPDGEADEYQRTDIKKMIELLAPIQEFVLCGDFNAPRGGEIFDVLAAKYKDNIPAQYTTSLDKNFHRNKEIEYMVDGLFTTPLYTTSNVQLIDGVSDHMAIVATITKAT